MTINTLTDAKIAEFLMRAKTVTNPKARESDKGSHRQWNYQVKGSDSQKFTLYVRQNSRIDDDFSCGLLWHTPSGEKITLVRYNGSSHQHPNRLEKTLVEFKCHIHRTTERYIAANLKPESFAEETDRYSSLQGALHALVKDCNIAGLQTEPDQPSLF